MSDLCAQRRVMCSQCHVFRCVTLPVSLGYVLANVIVSLAFHSNCVAYLTGAGKYSYVEMNNCIR